MKSTFIFLTVYVLAFFSCKEKVAVTFSNADVSKVYERMMEIMVHDITNPPLAARFFSYATLAAYEIVAQNSATFFSMEGRVNEYPVIAKASVEGASYQLSALLAMMEVSKKMQPSGSVMMKDFQNKFIDSCKKIGISTSTMDASLQYADTISKQILKYAKADKYNKISGYTRYQPIEGEGYWFPTPPGYFDAVEPYFYTVRPFMLDSASQFKPAPPIPFSTNKNEAFMKLLHQNYSDTLTQEHRMIAAFWDCNPFALKEQGHLMMSLKKISPGAHWIGIASIACKKTNKNFEEALQIHCILSMGLMDAFMSCWDEKFRSNRIRPETAIRKYIDPTWKPMLQTPPFPEYTSGHSVASGASATILTHFFGENFAYTDDVEVSYGLPARNFTSFHHAAEEAAMSRYYGGIHYMDAITNGLVQGKNVGTWVVKKIKK